MVPEGLTAWRVYLYAVSFIALIVAILGGVSLLAIAVEVFVHPAPQAYPVPHYYPDLPGSVAEVVVGLVIYCFLKCFATSSPATAAAAPKPGSGVGAVSTGREGVGGVTHVEA